MGRIECGGGEGGEPVLSPPGWKSYASWMHLTLGERAYCNDVPGVGAAVETCTGTSRVASPNRSAEMAIISRSRSASGVFSTRNAVSSSHRAVASSGFELDLATRP